MSRLLSRLRYPFQQTTFDSIEAASAHAHRALALQLSRFDYDLVPHGQQLAQLTRLKELFLQGSTSLDRLPSFSLPEEIGRLTELRKLTLFNLPIAEVPAWVMHLPKLRELLIRGTDVTALPSTLGQLRHLRRLRIENHCFPGLDTLPASLKQLDSLRHLSFAASHFRHFPVEHLPLGLKHLEISSQIKVQFSQQISWFRQQRPQLRLKING